MAVMMHLATQRRVMGPHVLGPRLRWLGWLATAAMAATVVAMLGSL
jgi:Mn2+/Fe2+ NRAMP family transporter